MNIAVLHSANPNSNSMRVAQHVRDRIGIPGFHVDDAEIPMEPETTWIIVVPNYGDGEIQAAMETFLVRTALPLRRFVVIELGNYYGFDDWGYGAADKVQRLLGNRGGQLVFTSLSMDSLPQLDWPTLDRWISALQLEVSHV
ncbi:MAG: flavodoxin-like domain-containing protein [Rhodocyclaceae bacterium]|nr:flavodoxin-like domain-containing protein [Rhodocyclaceae bacterium]